MMRNVFSSRLAVLLANPAYLWATCLAVAIGVGAAVVPGLSISYEFSYERWVDGAPAIVRIQGKSVKPGAAPALSARAPGVAFDTLRAGLGSVSAAARAIPRRLVLKQGDTPMHVAALLVDPQFVDVFRFPVVHGDLSGSLNQPSSVVVTETFAQARLGRTDVIGRTLSLALGDDVLRFQVTAVLHKLPSATHLDFEVLIPLREEYFKNEPWVLGEWYANSAFTYFRFTERPDLDVLQQALRRLQMSATPGFSRSLEDDRSARLELIPVRLLDIHLGAPARSDLRPAGDRRQVALLGLICTLSFTLAAANFSLLSLAVAHDRRAEIAVREILGATRRQVAIETLTDYLFILAIGAAIGLFVSIPVVFWMLSRLTATAPAAIEVVVSGILIGALVCAAIVTPAWLVMVARRSLDHGIALRSRATERPGRGLPAVMLTAQFAAAVMLSASTVVLYRVAADEAQADFGFDKAGLIMAHSSRPSEPGALPPAMLDALRKDRAVESVTAALVVPGETFVWSIEGSRMGESSATPKTTDARLELNFVLPDYFDVMRIPLLAGRAFLQSGSGDEATGLSAQTLAERGLNVIIDSGAAELMGFRPVQSALGERLIIDHWLDDIRVPATIVGVSGSYGQLPGTAGVKPARLFVFDASWATSLLVRKQPGVSDAAALEATRSAWRRFMTETPFRGERAADKFERLVERQELMALLFLSGAAAALIVAVIGAASVAWREVAAREREVAIRRALGASRADVVTRMTLTVVVPAMLGLGIGAVGAMYASKALLPDTLTLETRLALPMLLAALLPTGLALGVALFRLLSRIGPRPNALLLR
jgi:putative ABC transport system permease protein